MIDVDTYFSDNRLFYVRFDNILINNLLIQKLEDFLLFGLLDDMIWSLEDRLVELYEKA